MPQYLVDDGSPFYFREDGQEWWCPLCDRYATENHVDSLKHKKKKIWCPQPGPANFSANVHALSPIPTSGNHCPQGALTLSPWDGYYCKVHQRAYYHNRMHGLTTWLEPPSWWNQWVEQVRQAGMFDSTTIVNICGGPDLGGPEPPNVKFLADQKCAPTLSDVKSFFGNKVFENLKRCAQYSGKPGVAPFAEPGSTWAVVYTDGTPQRTRSPLSAKEWGMWFPTLVIEILELCMSGTQTVKCYSYCIDAAQNQWKRGWEVHWTRLHRYPNGDDPTLNSPTSSSSSDNPQHFGSADPVSHRPVDWTMVSTVVIEEIEMDLEA